MTPLIKTRLNRSGRPLLEKDIENYGNKTFTRMGFLCEKFKSPQKAHVPDRMMSGMQKRPGAVPLTFFIEYKKPDAEASEAQKLDHAERRTRGYYVFVIDCYELVHQAEFFIRQVLQEGRMLPCPSVLIHGLRD